MKHRTKKRKPTTRDEVAAAVYLDLPDDAVKCMRASLRLKEMAREIASIVKGVPLEGTDVAQDRSLEFDRLAEAYWGAALDVVSRDYVKGVTHGR
jgi:hypothetical protein